MVRRTKIICTLGPASGTPERITALIMAGMDLARINFSHGTHEENAARVHMVREAAAAVGKHVGVMADLQGPKIRIGALAGGAVKLEQGAQVTISTEPMLGTAERMSTTYEHFATDVKPGDPVLLADGLMRLRVDQVSGNDVLCTVMDGGTLGQHQGINLPFTAISAPSLSEKDVDDLAVAIALGVEYVALSFVRTATDVTELRARIAAIGGDAHIIAKIERAEGVRSIESIVDVADAVMVARGDLGVELLPQDVPLLQKKIIRVCNAASVPVITATQMLESMIQNPRPTRAEASDVANAVLDGTDAVMLSGETAAGMHPLEAVNIMSEICVSAERDLTAHAGPVDANTLHGRAMEHSVAESACLLAEELHAAAVLCLTRSGTTARLLSQCRPRMPVVAMTDVPATARRASLYWGVQSIVIPNPHHTESALHIMREAAVAHGIVATGDTVIITGGHPLTERARTNFVKVEEV